MSNQPTTIDELLAYSFLRNRLDRLRHQIATEPERTVLWIGAGFSAYFAGLPTWKSFLNSIVQSLPNESDRSIVLSIISAGRLQLASEYLESIIQQELFDLVLQTFQTQAIHRDLIIGDFCVPTIITTNYDSVIEQTLKWHARVSPLDSLAAILERRFKLVKLHGSIEDSKSVVLTVTGYAKAYNRDFAWYLADTFKNNSVVFIGCSLDPHEPFMQYMDAVSSNGLRSHDHFAIRAVGSDAEAAEFGKTLRRLGIQLIPYIPNGNDHYVLSDILNYVRPQRRKELATRASYIRQLVKQGRLEFAAPFAYQLCKFEVTEREDKRLCSDTLNSYISELLKGDKDLTLCVKLRSQGINIGQIALRTREHAREYLGPLVGLLNSLNKLQEHSFDNFEFLITDINREILELKRKSTQ